MTQLSRRLEQIVKKERSKNIIPVKTEKGSLVGEILIVSKGSIKSLYRHEDLLYNEIHLNAIAIKIANILAFKKQSMFADTLYKADQEYGRWFVDSQMLRAQYQKAVSNQNFERADMLWARYQESRDRTESAKNRAESLIKN